MLPPEVTQLIGKVGETILLEVEKGAIRKYADAVGDRNPLYWDEEYAKRAGFGGIIVPPGFFGWPARWGIAGPVFGSLSQEVTEAVAEAGYRRRLYGGTEYEFYRHIRAGDILSATPKIKDVYERQGKTGKMVFLVIETTYINQNGELVAKGRETVIRR